MAKVESEYINVNRLYGKPIGSSQVREAKGLYAIQNGVPVKKYRMFNGNTLTFDAWDTILESPDEFEIPAKGGNLQEFMDITSHYTRGTDEIESIPFSINPQSVVANNTTNIVEHNVTITQDKTNATITVKGIQKANEQAIEWGEITIKNVYVYNNEYISAVGGTNHPVYICALISQVKTSVNSSTGLPVTENVDHEVDLLSVKGSVLVSGTSVSGNMIYAPNRGTDNKGNRSVYTVTGGVVEMNGVTKEFSLNINQQFDVMQSQNYGQTVGSPTFTLNVDGISNNQSFDATQINEIVEIVSTQKQEYSWPSGVPNTFVESPCECRISFSRTGCTADPSSGSGEWVSTIKIPANTGSSTISTTITFNNGTTVTRKVSQAANSSTTTLTNVTVEEIVWDVNGETSGGYIEASGGSATVSVYLKKTYTTTSAATGSSNSYKYVWADSVSITGSGTASKSGDTITISDLRGNTSNTATTVYTVTKVTWSYKDENGKSWGTTTNHSKSIIQEANQINYGSWSYSISATTASTSYTAAATPVTATVTSKRTRSYTYTSNYTDSNGNVQTENCGWAASITSATGNSVSPTSASAGTTTAQISLGANTSTSSSKTTKVTFTNASSTSKTTTITYTQSKDELKSTSVNISAYSATASQPLASGGTATISLTLVKTSTPVYVSGNTGTPTTTYPTATVTSITGSAVNSSGAYISGTGVSVKSLGTTEKISAWNVFQVKSVTGTYDSKSYTYSTAFYVTQGPNTKSKDGSLTYTFTVDGGGTGITAASQQETITVVSTSTQKYKWTSESPADPVVSNVSCSVSTNRGTLSSSTVTGNSFVTITLPENTSLSNTQTTTVTFNNGQTSKSVSFVQDKDKLLSESITSVSPSSVVAEEIQPSGTSNVSITFNCSVTTTKKYYTNTNTTSSTTTKAATITGITGSAPTSGVGVGLISNKTTYLSCGSLGKNTTTSATTVYTITKVTGTILGWTGTLTWTGSSAVKMGINSSSTTYGAYSVTLSASPASGISGAGGTSTLTGTCKRAKTTTWASNASESGSDNAAATITVNIGSLSTSSITGSGTSTWTIPLNASTSAKSWTATIKCNSDTSKTAPATVSQNASTYVLEEQQNDIIPQAGGSFNVYIKSTRNGSAFAISKSNVSISGVTGTVNTVTVDTTHGAGGYKINITGVPANTTSSNRTMNVKVTQPESGKTVTVPCIQAGVTKTSKDVKWLGTFSFAPSLNGTNYSRINVSNPIFSAVDDDKYTYTGGTLSNVTFTVIGQNGNTVSTKNIGSVTVTAGSTTNISSSIPLSGLTGSTTNIPMYVKLSWSSSKGNTTEQHGIEDDGGMDQMSINEE